MSRLLSRAPRLPARVPMTGRAQCRGLPALLLALALVSSLAACHGPKRNPVPVASIHEAVIPGMPEVRAMGRQLSEDFQEDLERSILEENDEDFPVGPDGRQTYSALLVSGGGSNGAFGAGFLKGWTESGTRPAFKIVTGISAGALIAPFAFLGPEYDAKLEEVFTTIDRKDIYRKTMSRQSLAKTGPLVRLIAGNVGEEELAAIAEAHRRGRRLYIGTVNLDAQSIVVWNMGRIAEIGGDAALELFRDVLLASASLPVLFPPVMFDVEVDGTPYDELHVDGGVETQFFLFGATMDLLSARRGSEGDDTPVASEVYLIRNGWIAPVPGTTERTMQSIAGRSIATLIKSNAWGDLYRVHAFAEDAGIDFRFVSIPDDYRAGTEEMFDPSEMRRLFDLGLSVATSEDPWRSTLPGIRGSGGGKPGTP